MTFLREKICEKDEQNYLLHHLNPKIIFAGLKGNKNQFSMFL